MLSVCFNVSSQLLLKFNADKCKCVAFGKMAKSAMFGEGLQLDNGVVIIPLSTAAFIVGVVKDCRFILIQLRGIFMLQIILYS